VTHAVARLEPILPSAGGPISAAVIHHLECRAPRRSFDPVEAPVSDSDPYGLDMQLALSVCYELHYRGFAGVDERWEWDPGVLAFRARLEDAFLDAVRNDIGHIDSGATATDEMAGLSIEATDGHGPSYHLRAEGTWDQMREYFVHRSVYHLKEGDPHAWLIPRLSGNAKAAFVAVEFDEFGAGRGDQVHQQLYADLMSAADLDPTYLHYLNDVPAEALVAVNLMSLFGLHRDLRGAAVGHFAATEITSPPGSRRMAEALTRFGAPEPCIRFYREHVEADAVHEQVVRTEVVGDLVAREPHVESDVVFGIRAFNLVEDRLAAHLMTCWEAGRTSLRIGLT
jgi:Iron-containing redox enzyme